MIIIYTMTRQTDSVRGIIWIGTQFGYKDKKIIYFKQLS